VQPSFRYVIAMSETMLSGGTGAAKESRGGPMVSSTGVRIPLASLILLLWLIIGVIVAFNEGYDRFDTWSQFATFLLAVLLWPIPATGGVVGIRF
jgi:hypothetical protein